jgi:hypothetical protein
VVPEEFLPVLNSEHHGYAWCDRSYWPRPLHRGLLATMTDSATANKIDRILFNILEDIAREGLEPNEAFDGAYLESWLRDRGWIHD